MGHSDSSQGEGGTQLGEIDGGSREFWQLKECVGEIIWSTISPHLMKVMPEEALM